MSPKAGLLEGLFGRHQMRPAAKREYMKKTWERYVKADRKAKTRILDEFCATYECDRKYAIRLMRRGPQKEEGVRPSLCDFCIEGFPLEPHMTGCSSQSS